MNTTVPDYDEIVRVVQLYVDAFNTVDNNKFREAFDEDAWIFFTDQDGILHKHRFEGPGPGQKPFKVDGRIISVTQAGDIANVLLGFDDVSDPADGNYLHGSWVDFHTLLRINGVWKITNKTATHATRATWAADRNVQARQASVA